MKNIWSVVNSVLIIILFCYVLLFKGKRDKKVVFVDNVKVFQRFNMTNELGSLNEKKYNYQLTSFDSLVKRFSDLETYLKSKKQITKEEEQKYISLQRKVVKKENEIEEIRVSVKQDINKKVWNRLNSYIKTYGKENNIQLILGAQGGGNIMYGDSINDKTNEFIEYANYKYEGN